MQKNYNNQGECASLAYKVKSDYAYLTILVKTEVYFELKVEMKQSVKFTLLRKITSILIKKYTTNMINVTILNRKKGCFVIAVGARVPPSCGTTACDITGLVRSDGQYSNISISLHFIYLYIGNHFTK